MDEHEWLAEHLDVLDEVELLVAGAGSEVVTQEVAIISETLDDGLRCCAHTNPFCMCYAEYSALED